MKNTKLYMFAACTLFLAACGKQTVKIMTPPDASNRVLFGAEQLQRHDILRSLNQNDSLGGSK